MRRRPRSLLRSLFRDGEEISLSTFHPSSSAKKARKRALPARADLPSFFFVLASNSRPICMSGLAYML